MKQKISRVIIPKINKNINEFNIANYTKTMRILLYFFTQMLLLIKIKNAKNKLKIKNFKILINFQ